MATQPQCVGFKGFLLSMWKETRTVNKQGKNTIRSLKQPCFQYTFLKCIELWQTIILPFDN